LIAGGSHAKVFSLRKGIDPLANTSDPGVQRNNP
jgi:hypothetical protein